MTPVSEHTPTERCACGQKAVASVLISLSSVALCRDCYANEFPERAAVFALARRAPRAGEFRGES